MENDVTFRVGGRAGRLAAFTLATLLCALLVGALAARADSAAEASAAVGSADVAETVADAGTTAGIGTTGVASSTASPSSTQNYSFQAYVIPKVTYTDELIPIYVKTSYTKEFWLSFTDSTGRADGLTKKDRVDADDIINVADAENGGYKLGNAEGRIFAHSFTTKGAHTMYVRDAADNKVLAQFDMNIDYSYEEAENAYIDQLIKEQTNDSMDSFEKMDAIQSYLLPKMKYLKGFKSASGAYNGPCKLLEEYLGFCNPWWTSFIGDSYTTPDILARIATRVGGFTDVHNCYYDYPQGTDGWYSFHDKCRCTGADGDGKTQTVYYSICPSSTSNLVDAEDASGIAKIDFSEKWTSRWQKLVGTTVPDPISIEDSRVSISELGRYTYTGAQIKPDVTVTFKEDASSAAVELVEGYDYTLSYGENLDAAGDGFVTVCGIGRFADDTSKFFEIDPASVADATVPKVADQAYTGKAICPEPTVTVDGRTLVKGTDYTLSYKNNVNAGTATIIIMGEENYTGRKDVNFKIVSSASPDPAPTPSPDSGSDGADAWKRLAGNTAIGTMKAIVNEGWSSSDWAIVATTNGYYDALSASGLAGLLDCPILMTAPDKLTDATAKLITAKKVKNVIVVGGTPAVSDNVFNQIKKLGVSVERVAGGTAIGTANKIYERGKKVKDGWGTDAIVATASGYQDALSIAPFAYAKKAPIFLASGKPGTLVDSTAKLLKTGGFKRTIITGSEVAVAKSVESQVTGAKRLGGGTAYGTSRKIADFCIKEGMTAAHMGVATGRSYYDALAGAALCGKMNSVLILADDGNNKNVDNVVKVYKDKLEKSCYIFGGTPAVSTSVESKIKAASK